MAWLTKRGNSSGGMEGSGGNNNTSSNANENISSAMPQPKASDITYTQCLTETPHSNGASQLAKLTESVQRALAGRGGKEGEGGRGD